MKTLRPFIYFVLVLFTSSTLAFAQDSVSTYMTDPLYLTMDDTITIYVNVLSDEVLQSGQTIDPDSTVTAYTGLITTNSTNATDDWKYVVNSDWNDISIEMEKVNDSIFSLTIPDPATFYGIDPASESTVRIAFIARGTSNGSINGQTNNLYLEVFDSEPTALLSVQPALPNASGPAVVTLNAKQAEGDFAAYTDTVYAHTGVITNESSNDSDWKLVLTDWGVNNAKTRLMQVSDSVYRYYMFSDLHSFYGTDKEQNIEKLAFVFRSKVDPIVQTANLYVEVNDTVTLPEDPGTDPDALTSENAMKLAVYPNPASSIIKFSIPGASSTNIRFYTISGKELYNRSFENSGLITIPVSDIENNSESKLLFYRISTSEEIMHGKIVLQ